MATPALDERLATAGATTISTAATANVIRMPVAMTSTRAVEMSTVAEASEKTAPMTDAPIGRDVAGDAPARDHRRPAE